MSNRVFNSTILSLALLSALAVPQARPREQRLRTAPVALPTMSIGFFKSAGGISSETEVVDYKEGGVTGVVRRIAANPQGTSFKVGLLGARGFYDWFEDFFAGRRNPRSGAIRASDPDFKVRAQREFKDALITEISFPKFEAGSNERAYLTVSIEPEKITQGTAQGETNIYRDPNARQKAWMCSNFRLKLGNLPTNRVTKIDSFTIKHAHVYQHNQTDLEFLLVRFYVPEAEMAQWPVKANATPLKATGNEVAIETLEIAHEGLNIGSLEFLDPSRARLAQLEFRLKDLRAAPGPVNGQRSLLMVVQRPRLKVG